MEIKIDPEFSNMLPSLASHEFEELENSILAHGRALDPVKVWKETGILLDGHNRRTLCYKHELPFDVIEISLPDRAAAIEWIARNQFARRNLTPMQREKFIGMLYNASKKEQGGTGANQTTTQSGQNVHSAKTSKVIADQLGVSEKTVRRAAKATDLLAKIAETSTELAKAIEGSVKRIPAARIIELADNQEIADNVKKGLAVGLNIIAAMAMEEWNRLLEIEAQKIIKQCAEVPQNPWLDQNYFDMIQSQAKAAAETVRQFKGHGPCPKCRGKGCKTCRETGWMPKTELQLALKHLNV